MKRATTMLFLIGVLNASAIALSMAQQPDTSQKAPTTPSTDATTPAPQTSDAKQAAPNALPKSADADQTDTPAGIDREAEEAAIRALAEKYVESYNRRDSKTMASLWSPEAIYMDPNTGEGVVGRDAIAKQFDYAFAGSEDAKLRVDIASIDFLSPNVAIEKGRGQPSNTPIFRPRSPTTRRCTSSAMASG
jgi:uncharacterized protein (TIGR02246 family)